MISKGKVYMRGKEFSLLGLDIYDFVEKISDKLGDDPPYKMTANEEMAYKLGIDEVMDVFDQTLNEMIKSFGETDGCKYIAVHVPGLETVTEFINR